MLIFHENTRDIARFFLSSGYFPIKYFGLLSRTTTIIGVIVMEAYRILNNF